MYYLVHTHTKLEITYALSYVTHTFYVTPQYQIHSKSRKRYYNPCNSHEKIKQDPKQNIFVF